MKREKLITRTIISTIAKVKVADLTSNEINTKEFTLAGSYKSMDEVMKVIKAQPFDNTAVPIMVESVEEIEKLYGVTEAQFMAMAKELPPRKVYEQ